jgi:ATP-dependent exoDNAse (exonuclease V) beta subunit
VLRDGDPATDARFVVVDYKTNRLAPADQPLTVGPLHAKPPWPKR